MRARARACTGLIEGLPTTVPFDFLAGWAAGAGVALSAVEPLARTSDPLRSRYFGVVLLFSGAAMVPAGFVLYALYPDWSLMYLANPAHVPWLVMIPLVLASYVLGPAAGFVVTQRLIAARNDRGVRIMLGTVAAAALLLVVAGWRRLVTVAYYETFHYGGETISLFKSPLVLALALIIPAVAFAFVFSVLHVRRHVEALRRASEKSLPPRKPALG